MRNKKQTKMPPQPDSLYKTYIFPPPLKNEKKRKCRINFHRKEPKKKKRLKTLYLVFAEPYLKDFMKAEKSIQTTSPAQEEHNAPR